MRVCLIIGEDLSAQGQKVRHVLGLRQALHALGDEAWVLGPASGAVPPHCHGLATVPGLEPIGLGVMPQPTLEFVHGQRFDVLHLHEPTAPGPTRHVAALAQLPMVATFHGFWAHDTLWRRGLRRLASRSLSRVAAGIAVSETAVRFAQEVYSGGPITVIAGGVVGQDFAGPPRAPEATLHILFAGPFGARHQGLAVLQRAVRVLRTQGRSVQLTVVGAGRARRSDGVEFVGSTNTATLAAHHRQAHIVCAPALDGEGFGSGLLEAMAAGVPVVASDIPGHAEAAGHCAVLVPPNQPLALADALWRVHTSPDLRQSLVAAGLLRAASLDWRNLVRRVRGVYVRVLGAAAAQRRAG